VTRLPRNGSSPGGHDVEEDARATELMAAVRQGDMAALAALYVTYAPLVRTYARTALGSQRDSDDLTQEVFLRVLRFAHMWDPAKGRFRAWLFTITHRRVITHHHQEAPMVATDPTRLLLLHEAAQLIGDDELIDPVIHREDLVPLLRRLPLPQREVIALRFLLDLSAPEIAQVTGRTPASVRQLQRRALQAMAAGKREAPLKDRRNYAACSLTVSWPRFARRPAFAA
jgi:RNA polymerase sigma-70 factor (ECF subfamily)